MIKAKDPRLQLISFAVLGLLTIDLIPQGVLQVELPLQCTAEEEAITSLPVVKEEEEVVEISEFEDEFEVFNHNRFPEALAEDFSHLPLAEVSQIPEDSTSYGVTTKSKDKPTRFARVPG